MRFNLAYRIILTMDTTNSEGGHRKLRHQFSLSETMAISDRENRFGNLPVDLVDVFHNVRLHEVTSIDLNAGIDYLKLNDGGK